MDLADCTKRIARCQFWKMDFLNVLQKCSVGNRTAADRKMSLHLLYMYGKKVI